jgi:hypothetical protein
VAGDEVDSVAGLEGREPEPDGECSLADSRRPEEEDVDSLVEEAERLQASDDRRIDRGLGLEVEFVEPLAVGQAGKLEVGLDSALVAGSQLEIEEPVEDIDCGELFDPGSLEDVVEGFEGRAHLETFESAADPLVGQLRLHGTSS